ncbi:MAG: hypothetical protein AAF399_15320 [Bacteroidota bacterium]
MKYFLLYGGLTLMLGMGWSASACAQPTDTSQIEYIYLEKSGVTLPPRTNRAQQGFFRNLRLHRLILSESPNQGLWNLSHTESQLQQGIAMHLMDGLRNGFVKGYHPADLQEELDYFDLMYELMQLQGINLRALEGGFSQDQLDFSPLEDAIDLVVEEGFSAETSRSYVHIRYLRLIWHDPETGKAPIALVIFPYEEVRQLLEQLEVRFQPDQLRAMNVKEALELQRFRAHVLPINQDPTQVMPSRHARTHRPLHEVPMWWER